MEHDKGYKRLFSHPKIVKDLLRGFVHEEWVRDLDFATLENFKDSLVSDDLRSRHDDIIWRVRWGADWLYVYLLLEFQSTIDSFMAVRLMVYIGLLYQHLIDAKELAEDDKLPPVLPLVIYNGAERWDAALDIGELIADAPEGLKKYRPQLQYFLIDEGSFSEAQLASLHNLTAALFRMENCRRLESREEVLGAMRNVLVQVTDWLKEPAQAGLRRDFVTWLSRVLLPNNVPGMQVPEVIELQE
ncbi:MAG: Rpn family recombination-promoting nuclease/putative transposase, partial [Gammaproteobacteria bacterium]|nr:Rpn family recombination-promoting nuclease/putative transposase [Gammaproteobacteria bacterium]